MRITNYSQFIRNSDDKIYDFHSDDIFRNWIYSPKMNELNKKAITEFKKWLNDHRHCYCHLYHGTDGNLPILEEGLKRTSSKTKKSYQSGIGYVYLSVFPDSAKTFGDIAYPYSKETSVYKVCLNIGELLPDKDQLTNMRSYGGMNLGNSLSESLIYGNGACIKRNILPYEISLLKTFEKNK
jgi:hypothetical protein